MSDGDTGTQVGLQLAWINGSYFAIWQDTQQNKLLAARISPAGAVLDSPAAVVSGQLGSSYETTAALATDGVQSLLFWNVYGDNLSDFIEGGIVTGTTLSDSVTVMPLDGKDTAAVLTDGGAGFLAYNNSFPAGNYQRLFVRSVFCADCTGAGDAGLPDAGQVIDAGTDAGADAGPVDAGEADAGHIDAGNPDAGEIDAGSDAGTVDAGIDAGPIDAGAVADAGTTPTPPGPSGCGCTTSGQSSSLLGFALLLMLAKRKRRAALPRT